MTPTNSNGAGHHPDAATSANAPNAQAKGTAPFIWATAFPPVGKRRWWLIIVHPCPYCSGGAHAHRGGPNGGLRRAGCGHGSYYVRPRLSPTAQRGAA